jgi:acetylornithine deacetylase/succinyl-diaminopimelate desuccinylase-like protein
MAIDHTAIGPFTDLVWENEILPMLTEYIRIPNVSEAYDAGWAEAGHMDRAVELARAWCATREVVGLTVEVVRLPKRSPVLLLEIPPFGPAGADDTVLLYGHLDKQPPMHGWREGLGPWEPVLMDGRLYGRGGADDGYAVFASLTAIEAVQRAGGAHGRCVVLIECSEESGSPDLPDYVEHLADRIGTPGLVVCLDSFCGDYERLWTTTSLRGNLILRVRVDILTEGVHSGSSGGVVPSSTRILRRLLDRLEDSGTGELLVPELHVEIPEGRKAELAAVAADLGRELTEVFPFVPGAGPMGADPLERLTNKTWRPSLAYTGLDGIPPGAQAGNVLRPFTDLTLSIRVPPGVDAEAAGAAVARTLTADPPYGAEVTVTVASAEDGWDAPPTAPWLAEATEAASQQAFGKPLRSLGEGGTIPFMAMLGRRFPEAQYLLTGVLGPGSNAHGPNEFLHVGMGKRVTACVAAVLDAHAHRSSA